jgi:hypothetical protein
VGDLTTGVNVATMGDVDREQTAFLERCRQPHLTVRKCFMTGKPCVYDEVVESRVRRFRFDGTQEPQGFMITPFRPNLNAFFEWSLSRFFRHRYKAQTEILQRADQARRTGYVVCEKICRQIQEAAFVVADVSVDNANVFYELGLAYGLEHKIIIVHDVNSDSARTLKREYFPDWMRSRIYEYPSLKPIPDKESFSQRFVVLGEGQLGEPRHNREPRIVMLDMGSKEPPAASGPAEDINLSFADVMKGAIGVSITEIADGLEGKNRSAQFLRMIRAMKTAEEVRDRQFETIRAAVDSSFCVLVRTSKEYPFSYFWLGYCHAIGKNVIPVWEVDEEDDQIDDLAFDIRALWHMVLARKEPTRVLPQLRDILTQMIESELGEWSRREFWSRILGRTRRVSIFTGALRNGSLSREMVGDWDLRAAAELMSYFSSHQQVATIESPIYQPENMAAPAPESGRPDKQVLQRMGDLLKGRNAIVIASPDVNPLTELVLGRLYGIPQEKLFQETFDLDLCPDATAAVKQRRGGSEAGQSLPRFFFQEEAFGPAECGDEESAPPAETAQRRGFRGNWLPEKGMLARYLSQSECAQEEFTLYAHLVIALNPFSEEGGDDGQPDSFVLVLNGISGPSTFALTQLLTGSGGSDHPVGGGDREPGQQADATVFDAEVEAERILSTILNYLEGSVVRRDDYYPSDSKGGPVGGFLGVQAIVEVTVGPSPETDKQELFDSRTVTRWKIVDESLKLIPRPVSRPISRSPE